MGCGSIFIPDWSLFLPGLGVYVCIVDACGSRPLDWASEVFSKNKLQGCKVNISKTAVSMQNSLYSLKVNKCTSRH